MLRLEQCVFVKLIHHDFCSAGCKVAVHINLIGQMPGRAIFAWNLFCSRGCWSSGQVAPALVALSKVNNESKRQGLQRGVVGTPGTAQMTGSKLAMSNSGPA